MNIVTVPKIDRICTIPFFFVVVADFSLKRHQSARRKYFFLPLSEPVTISKGADLSMHSEKAA